MAVYQIPYSFGQVYIGETIRRLETRLKEHKSACSKGQLEKSAVAEPRRMEAGPSHLVKRDLSAGPRQEEGRTPPEGSAAHSDGSH